jgi:hypothetical protein
MALVQKRLDQLSVDVNLLVGGLAISLRELRFQPPQ